MSTTGETQSILDQMTQGIMTRKEAKSAGLTPVGLEGTPSVQKRGLRELKGDEFPYDGGIGETASQSITNVRKLLGDIQVQLSYIAKCLDSIERECELPAGGLQPVVAVATPAIDAQHEIEKAADEHAAFQKTFKAQQKAAQAAAFVGLDDPGDTPVVVEQTELAKAAGTIWACPNGHATVNILTSRKGRVYGMCTTCHEFQKP